MKIGNIIQNGFKIPLRARHNTRLSIRAMDGHIRTPEQGFKGEGRAGITGGLGADGRTDLY